MNQFLFSIVGFLVLCTVGFPSHESQPKRAAATAKGNRIECKNVIEGEEVGGKFETKMTFDSSAPSLVDNTTITLTGQKPKPKKKTHLDSKTVCGLDLDFSKDCKVKEKIDPKLGYSFNFTCGNEITLGEVYCDEDCFTTGGGATFRCEGPKVDKELGGHGINYAGCKFTKAS